MSVLASVVAFGLDTIGAGPTPLAILLVVLLFTLIALAVMGGLSQAGARLVDRRWPADEPLTPAELLWGETGSYVGKTFPGLDPVIAHDLTQYIKTKKVNPGEAIIEAGDLPTEFVLVKSGDVEIYDPRQMAPIAAKAGASFGSEAILRRQPHPFTVRAKSPCEVLSLPAEDYLAGLALGAQRGEDRFVLDQLSTYLAEPGLGMPGATHAPTQPVQQQQRPQTQQPVQQEPQQPVRQQPQQPVQQPFQPQEWPAATHRIGSAAIPGYALPADRAPNRVLPPGMLIAAYETLPGWLHIRSIDGWDGWVADSGLIRLR